MQENNEDYVEEKAKKELKELLQIIPVKTENEEFVNEINEHIRNHEYSIALTKIEDFLEANDEDKIENKENLIQNMPTEEFIEETQI